MWLKKSVFTYRKLDYEFFGKEGDRKKLSQANGRVLV